MVERASVIVVGAGIIGCSVAFQLARMGGRNVVVLEREPLPGTGSTSRANGGIRAQFTTGANVRMSLLSMEFSTPSRRRSAVLPPIGRPATSS
jgi:sarcosine oxidase subunit beta